VEGKGWRRWCGDYINNPGNICSAEDTTGTFLAWPTATVKRVVGSNAAATSYEVVTATATSLVPTASPARDTSSDSAGVKIGLGVALGVGIPLAAGFGILIGRRSVRSGAKREAKHDTHTGNIAPPYYSDMQSSLAHQSETTYEAPDENYRVAELQGSRPQSERGAT